MATATIKKILNSDIQSVWETVLCVKRYSRWRSDLSKTQVIHDGRFIEYTKDGFATHFTVTKTEPYRRWEFGKQPHPRALDRSFYRTGHTDPNRIHRMCDRQKLFDETVSKAVPQKAAGTVCAGFKKSA